MNVVLISTYELGHQPFGMASARAWLARDGHRVDCMDLAVERFSETAVRGADLVAFSLPMHTATRLALPVIERVKRLNPRARLACFGLYAALNAELLRAMGVESIAGGEFEPQLVELARGGKVSETVSLGLLDFMVPERELTPAGGVLANYARLEHGGESKPVAYTEASRGCKHLCRHCPVVPVYQGRFRVVQRDVVLEDIRRQVAAGARHVTFGDPDFLNGPTHALRIVEAVHAAFPGVTYDATIKIEHLLKHRDMLPRLRDTGCLFITSAVESLDDRVLAKLEKHHTRADFLEAVDLCRRNGLTLQPTFIAFTPWTTLEGYRDLLGVLAELDLIENVGSIQLALRLLVTSGSRLLELDEIREAAGPFDPALLVYPWSHANAAVDDLGRRIFRMVHERQKQGLGRAAIFREICVLAGCESEGKLPEDYGLMPRATVPYLNEPWYC